MTLREDRYRRERDEAREEVTRLREQMMADADDEEKYYEAHEKMKAQLQLANAVCEHDAEFPQWQSDEKKWGLEHEELIKAWRATQKGGE